MILFLKKITFYWLAYSSRFFRNETDSSDFKLERIRSLVYKIFFFSICFKI
ncbi:hypothetical protein LEP1GSC018_3158 [Leptospira kirschneri str. 2008720114]|nr:hypothetical protein LEP1GSC018_3158 [Leptospira kirschneri str. 2008720114]